MGRNSKGGKHHLGIMYNYSDHYAHHDMYILCRDHTGHLKKVRGAVSPASDGSGAAAPLSPSASYASTLAVRSSMARDGTSASNDMDRGPGTGDGKPGTRDGASGTTGYGKPSTRDGKPGTRDGVSGTTGYVWHWGR